ncbi:MAG: hydrogenase maturation nickel metallochaperone HypA [Mesorhizobium sp.]|nr:MAG: hydrogenase maturation nickel metallochaperone HypA [Mesorhizobium sp.]
MSTNLWIKAASVLAINSEAVVKCPECGDGNLLVIDAGAGTTHVERHMRCPKCGAYNALLKNIGDT